MCSFELANRLKELGVEQESDFYWCQPAPNVIKPFCSLCREHRTFGRYDKLCSAFTVAELGEMLPEYLVGDDQIRFDLTIWRDSEMWNVSYWWDEDTRRLPDMRIETTVAPFEADARAKMLIYLLETKLRTV